MTFYLLCFILMLSSCNKPVIESDLEIEFINREGEFTCGEACGTIIDIEGKGYYKSELPLPPGVYNTRDYFNYSYIADVEFLSDSCTCRIAGDLKPGYSFSDIKPGKYRLIRMSNIRRKN